MASSHRYQWSRADGTTGKAWRAKYVIDGVPHSKRGFTRKGDAEAYARDREAEARHGVNLGESQQRSRVTVEQWCTTWFERQYVRPSTAEHYRAAVSRIVDGLGRRPLSSLREDELRGWRKAAGDRYAPSTVDRMWSVLGSALRAAAKEGLMSADVIPTVRRVERPRIDLDELLTAAQVRAWGEAMPLEGQEMPVVASLTGLRQGELLGLRLPNVDFLRREIRVVEQLATLGAGTPVFAPPKTRSSVRAVPLPGLAADALARHLARFPAVDGEPIFRGHYGQRWRRGTFGTVVREAKADAGLPAWATWHGLRKCFASGVIRAGMDPMTLVALMGWSSLSEAMVYLRLHDDSIDRARRAIDGLAGEDQNRATTGAEGR